MSLIEYRFRNDLELLILISEDVLIEIELRTICLSSIPTAASKPAYSIVYLQKNLCLFLYTILCSLVVGIICLMLLSSWLSMFSIAFYGYMRIHAVLLPRTYSTLSEALDCLLVFLSTLNLWVCTLRMHLNIEVEIGQSPKAQFVIGVCVKFLY